MDNSQQPELPFQYDFDGESSLRVSYNDVIWGVYSASRTSTHPPGTVIDTVRSQFHRTTIKLITGRLPTFSDYRIARAEQYLLQQTYNRDEILKVLDREVESQKQALLKNTARRRKSQKDELLNELTPAEERYAALSAMEIVALKFPIVYSSAEMDRLLKIPRCTSMLKESAETRRNCIISTTTTYYHGRSKEEVILDWGESPLAQISVENRNHKTKFYSSPHPALLYGYLQGKYFENDLNLINSFDSSIAGILSEWLRLRLYGTIIHQHKKLKVPYLELTNHLKIKAYTTRFLILQQFQKAIDELIERKIIKAARLIPTEKYTDSASFAFEFTPSPSYIAYIKERDLD